MKNLFLYIPFLIIVAGCSSATSSDTKSIPSYLNGTWESDRIENDSQDFMEKIVLGTSNDKIKADITVYYFEGPIDSVHFSVLGTLNLPILSFDNGDDSFECSIRSSTVMNCEVVDPYIEEGIFLFKQ